MSASAEGPPAEEPPGSSHGGEPDAPFRSASVGRQVMQHHLWHGDLLADAISFAQFRQWLEARLPRVTQTAEGYFTAALVRNRLSRFLRFSGLTRRAAPGHREQDRLRAGAGHAGVHNLPVDAGREQRACPRHLAAPFPLKATLPTRSRWRCS